MLNETLEADRAYRKDIKEAYEWGYAQGKADAEPKKGKWIIKDDTERFIAQCNCCRYIEDSRRIKNYCPNCGAKMEE